MAGWRRTPLSTSSSPKEHARKGGQVGVVDDPAQFLTPAEVWALVAATPWPYNVLVHVARGQVCGRGSWRGYKLAMLTLPDRRSTRMYPTKPGSLHVQRVAPAQGSQVVYMTPKPESVDGLVI